MLQVHLWQWISTPVRPPRELSYYSQFHRLIFSPGWRLLLPDEPLLCIISCRMQEWRFHHLFSAISLFIWALLHYKKEDKVIQSQGNHLIFDFFLFIWFPSNYKSLLLKKDISASWFCVLWLMMPFLLMDRLQCIAANQKLQCNFFIC